MIAFAIFSSRVIAHSGGIPILRMNGQWVQSNHISNYAKPANLHVASDLAPERYTVGQRIDFEVNPAFRNGSDGKSPLRFKWDFGDGTLPVEAPIISHTYQKAGSYVVTLLFGYPTQDEYYPYDDILVNVYDSSRSKAPRALMKIDGKVQSESFQRGAPFDFGKTVSFDAGESKGEGLTYTWDFGDRTIATGEAVTHTYKNEGSPVFVALLRATDKNGVASDAAVFLTERDHAKKTAVAPSSILNSIITFFKKLFRIQ